eukprot:1998171-Karenia_brevis.AAC.1
MAQSMRRRWRVIYPVGEASPQSIILSTSETWMRPIDAKCVFGVEQARQLLTSTTRSFKASRTRQYV